ncbi:nicotinate-nucleotide--dimethylbenzimidazole phosphoribosyltransferase [Parendozoicomonas haliclonae]|uniref:Nicotinate-nucleotide--dimethylbenzimidazole phosphoribosyltransferase n=1 Tax=Parendozoicomonas haliclonae TaxID=1960125 RepID=A0A1X7ALU5_9GAMM|nr:nicotinate-nucleotide--dimethylbenzimidazole phosphoribosyltransferase [Parendozoicomonas haliclonae]SMA49113.1 Nicotinate-nucleotide-dimethylbenzimidazole phosphoribosyltransferase [Parendozoicomonas haliclonae]
MNAAKKSAAPTQASSTVIEFLTTAGCHLCEQPLSWLERMTLQSSLQQPLQLECVDIAEDDQLVEDYGTRIPVLRRQASEGWDELAWPFTLGDLRCWLEGVLPGGLESNWYEQPVKAISEIHAAAAKAHQEQLTKPSGSLGLLEEAVIALAGMQGTDRPALDAVAITVFAGDHGVVQQGVSAFPQEVTPQMIGNFVHGGAAISVLARQQNCRLSVLDTGTCVSPLGWPGVIDQAVGLGTADFSEAPAMSQSQLDWCLAAGAAHIDQLLEDGPLQLFIAGEMGIGNTTTATAVSCALTDFAPALMVGRGTGLDDDGLLRKQKIVEQALSVHKDALATPLDVLRFVGGFELAAMCGAVLRCAQKGVPVLVDGFIVSSAVLCAVRLQPSVAEWLLWGHTSMEPGHRLIQQTLMAEHPSVRPLLDLNMRLGEASGAAVALPLLRLACALHNEMHTFEEAGVAASSSAAG